jgi:hypothetical protein
MKLLIALLLLVPTIAYSNPAVKSSDILPIVQVSNNQFVLKDTRGNRWSVQTSCPIELEQITQFTVRDRYVKAGTKIKLADNITCNVHKVSRS